MSSRAFAVGHIKTLLDTHAAKSKAQIEASGQLDALEKGIQRGLTDANPTVREPARLAFWSFYAVWPDRASAIMEKLDLTARRQLQRVSPIDLPGNDISPPPEPKKSSVAAAIAASRAKAKQIAAAPPSLRHQATSASHISHSSSQTSTMSRIVSAPNVSPKSIRSISSASSVRPNVAVKVVRKGRTPSTATLPGSSDGSARNSPSPTFSRGSADMKYTRIPSPTFSQGSADMKYTRIPSPTGRPKSRTQRTPTSTRSQVSARTPMTPSKFRDVATPSKSTSKSVFRSTSTARSNPERPSSPYSVSSGVDNMDESFSLMSFTSPTATRTGLSLGTKNSRAMSSSLSLTDTEPAIEEELKARTAQAESAAEQLLDLTMPMNTESLIPTTDDEFASAPNQRSFEGLPSKASAHSLFATNGTSPDLKATSSSNSVVQTPPRSGSKNNLIWQAANAFEDSPAQSSSRVISVPPTQKQSVAMKLPTGQNNWWVKTKDCELSMIFHLPSTHTLSVLEKATLPKTSACPMEDLPRLLALMLQNMIAKEQMWSLFLLCKESSAVEGNDNPESPMYQDMEKLLKASIVYIANEKVHTSDTAICIVADTLVSGKGDYSDQSTYHI